MNFLKAPLIAGLAILSLSFAQAQPATPDAAAKPDVATLLFGTPQWGNAPVGSKITYSYSKKTTDVKFGESFDDRVLLTLDKGEDANSRVVEMRLFTSMHTRPSGPTQSDPENPVLLFMLSLNLENIDKIFGIPNPRYLRNAIRKAWREDPKIEKADIEVGGKKVPGTRISVTPFAQDPQKDRMQGLEGMIYTVEIADSVPGQIAKIDIHAPADGPAKYSEVLQFKSEDKQ